MAFGGIPFDPERLPRWKCHKTVRAAKIVSISGIDPTVLDPMRMGATLGLQHGELYWAAYVSDLWFQRFHPLVDGYLVFYDDGYMSFSPAKAFEDGYTEIK